MNSSKLAISAGLLAGLLVLTSCATQGDASPGAKGADGGREIAAYINDTPIYTDELEADAIAKVMRAKSEAYDLLLSRLNRIAYRKLIAKESEEAGMEVNEYLKSQVGGSYIPTEEEILQFWEDNKEFANGKSLEEMRERIIANLEGRYYNPLIQEYVRDIMAAADVRMVLPPPKIDVEVPDTEPSKGPADAPITMVAFSDFECPSCRDSHPTIERLLAEYADKIRFVYRDFPLQSLHPRAIPAANAARCAAEQDQYWVYFDSLMTKSGDLSDLDLTNRADDLGLDAAAFSLCYHDRRYQEDVENSVKAGRAVGVGTTPTFFINGRILYGNEPYEKFKAAVDLELRLLGLTEGA